MTYLNSVDGILSQVSKAMTKEESAQIIVHIPFADNLQGSSRRPRFSSPMMDDLSSETLNVITSRPRSTIIQSSCVSSQNHSNKHV